MNNLLDKVDGYKAYIGAAIIAGAAFAEVLGVPGMDTLRHIGLAIVAVGLRHAFDKIAL